MAPNVKMGVPPNCVWKSPQQKGAQRWLALSKMGKVSTPTGGFVKREVECLRKRHKKGGHSTSFMLEAQKWERRHRGKSPVLEVQSETPVGNWVGWPLFFYKSRVKTPCETRPKEKIIKKVKEG